jgi:hypothetical protein
VRWRRHPEVLWRSAPSYLVLATVDGHTVEVDGPGVDVWAQLTAWISEDELTGILARRYGAEERVVSPDVRALLHQLHTAGFVERDG